MNRTTRVQAAETAIGYDFRNPELLWESLQAAGSPHVFVGGRYLREGNKVLAGIGDAVLNLVLKTQARDLNLSIGASTIRISELVNNNRLAAVCDDLGLSPCVVLNPSARGHMPISIKANTLEAVLGAVFRDSDSDIETCKSVMAQWGITLDPPEASVMSTSSPSSSMKKQTSYVY